VAEIQGEIIKRGKQNVVSRLFHANDEEAIATWRLGLNRILHVFNVRPTTSVWPSLTFRSQTELGTNAHITVSDDLHEAANTHAIPNTETIVPGVRHDVSNTHAIVSVDWNDVANTHTASDINRNTSRDYTDGQNQAVSTTRTLPVTRQPLTAAQTHARSAISTTNESSA